MPMCQPAEVKRFMWLGMLEAAARGLLRGQQGELPFDEPDGVVITLDADGAGDVTWTKAGRPVGGESL